MRNQIAIGEVLEAQAFGLKASLYKFMPGIVQAYYASSNGSSPATVDVQPAIHDVRIDVDTGALVYEPWPVLPKVPLAMPMSSQTGAGMKFALKKGDKVTLLGFDLDPTSFRATGNAGNPIDTGRHTGGHWHALPFDMTDGGGNEDPGGDLVVTAPTGGAIVLGEGATDAPALASVVDGNFNAIIAYLKNLVGLGTGPVEFSYVDAPAAAAPVTYTGAAPPTMNATGATVVKAK